jgi:hypothetical protein
MARFGEVFDPMSVGVGLVLETNRLLGGGRNTGIQGISSCRLETIMSEGGKGYETKRTDRTSLATPALFNILTTPSIPLDSSNTRRAGGESTRIHNNVSNTADARVGEKDDDDALGLDCVDFIEVTVFVEIASGEGEGVDRVRDSESVSNSIYSYKILV